MPRSTHANAFTLCWCTAADCVPHLPCLWSDHALALRHGLCGAHAREIRTFKDRSSRVQVWLSRQKNACCRHDFCRETVSAMQLGPCGVSPGSYGPRLALCRVSNVKRTYMSGGAPSVSTGLPDPCGAPALPRPANAAAGDDADADTGAERYALRDGNGAPPTDDGALVDRSTDPYAASGGNWAATHIHTNTRRTGFRSIILCLRARSCHA